jgi:hypothetical protein
LPKGFANSTVIIEQISDTELRIVKARVIPEKELQFPEVTDKLPLSDRDRDRFLSLLDNPSPPTQALLQAAKAAKKADMSQAKGEQESGKGHRG